MSCIKRRMARSATIACVATLALGLATGAQAADTSVSTLFDSLTSSASGSASRYHQVDISGVFMTEKTGPSTYTVEDVPELGMHTYTLDVSSGASFTDVFGTVGKAGKTYKIASVFGVFAANVDLAGSLKNFSVGTGKKAVTWQAKNSQDGYETQGSNGLATPSKGTATLPGFTFNVKDYSDVSPVFWGYHISYWDDCQLRTAYFEGLAPVPELPSGAGLALMMGLGSLGLVLRGRASVRRAG